MTSVVAILTQRGKAGKTTCTVNLADAFVRRGRKVLVIDMDPQGNTSKALTTVEASFLRYTTCEFMSERDIAVNRACIIESRIIGLDLVASSIHLARKVETDLMWRNTITLRNRLELLIGAYDIVLIDCPSDLGFLTRNALCAATHYLMPLDGSDTHFLDGIDDFEDVVREAYPDNSGLVQMGAFLNMFDGRKNVGKLVAKTAEDRFGSALFNTRLPDAPIFKEASALNKTVMETARDGSAAKAVAELCDEILEHLPARVSQHARTSVIKRVFGSMGV